MKKSIFTLALFLVMAKMLAQPTNLSPKGIGGGGALFFPTINPANDNEYYVSCDMSQLFHTNDFGASYSQLYFSKLQVLIPPLNQPFSLHNAVDQVIFESKTVPVKLDMTEQAAGLYFVRINQQELMFVKK